MDTPDTSKDKEMQEVSLEETKPFDNNGESMMGSPTDEPDYIDTQGTSKGRLEVNTCIYNESVKKQNISINTSDKLNATIGSNEIENQLKDNLDASNTIEYKESIRISIEFESKVEEDSDVSENDNICTLHNDNINSIENIDNTKIEERKRCFSQQNENLLNQADRQLPKRQKVSIFTNDSLPQWYHVRGALVTLPVIPTNLPKAFEGLPIYGKPNSKDELESFQTQKLREFIGCDLDDEEFDELSKYCSPDHLKTGIELSSKTCIPTPGIFPLMDVPKPDSNVKLNILKKCKLRLQMDLRNKYTTKLKYRAVRLIPQSQENIISISEAQLEPGRDILYNVRIYRPYSYVFLKERTTRGRHSIFSFNLILSGRQMLTALRDRIVCHNDLDMRVDVSNTPDILPATTCKDVFPSGFLFINNVFYVDTRDGCSDLSAVIRDWAAKRGMGVYTKKDMCTVRLDDINIKLGYPEVYMHQGNCEHVFTFSEIRLVTPRDQLRLAQYPYVHSTSQNQTIYCTTCAEFGAKWIVVGCRLVPFDPAFFCDTCFKQYMYKDGMKIGDFKAYSYRGNETNMLKPQV